MNIVFWFLVLLAIFLIWVALSPIFQDIGNVIINTKENVEDNLIDKNEEDY
jgi:hypothetical protein